MSKKAREKRARQAATSTPVLKYDQHTSTPAHQHTRIPAHLHTRPALIDRLAVPITYVVMAIITATSYTAAHTLMIQHSPQGTVPVSSLTTNLILTFAVVAILARRISALIYPRLIPIPLRYGQWITFFVVMAALAYWMTLFGYETRW